MKKTTGETGQAVVILLLVVVVGLAVGLAVVGRSITEISTSTKIEESSRALSAAEAGIERALKQNPGVGQGNTGNLSTPLGNQASAETNYNPELPLPGKALEYPPFGKESFAQFWLANPWEHDVGTIFPKKAYGKEGRDVAYKIYFGKVDDAYYSLHPDDKPAVKVTTFYRDNQVVKSQSTYIDSYAGRNEGFSNCGTLNPPAILTNDNLPGEESTFYCSTIVNLNFSGSPPGVTGNRYPILVRVRIVYSNIAHPVAVAPLDDQSLPKQTTLFNSVGRAGSVQRTLQVFREKSVMPFFFDYAIFSAGAVNK